MIRRIASWLETHWVMPAYSGWLMSGLAIFFFGAATNTMSGWLYVLSGVMLALLAIAALLSERTLRGIRVVRKSIAPVSVGEPITVEILLENHTTTTKSLLQVQDELPTPLGRAIQAIEVIPVGETYHWVYQHPASQRGVYRWNSVSLRTAAPLGLFWCRRYHDAKALVVVYPTVLPLHQCPLIDQMGQDVNQQQLSAYQTNAATEGLTRTLRPYRWGDSIRLVHWRTSARYGELRVRELETYTGGNALTIALDSGNTWEPDAFEQAVVAAASLYFYALNHNISVSLWTAGTGLVRGDQSVLETLAAVQWAEEPYSSDPPDQAILWISQQSHDINRLPTGSQWLVWRSSIPSNEPMAPVSALIHPGLVIQPDQPLELQLQTAP